MVCYYISFTWTQLYEWSEGMQEINSIQGNVQLINLMSYQFIISIHVSGAGLFLRLFLYLQKR